MNLQEVEWGAWTGSIWLRIGTGGVHSRISLMYELKKKKVGKVMTIKSLGTGLPSYKNKLPGRGLTKVEKHWTK